MTGPVISREGVLVLLLALVLAGCSRRETRESEATPLAPSEDAEPKSPRASGAANEGLRYVRDPDVHYVPTPQPVVERMLELAGVTRNDVVYDLGSGDGRIVITAARRYGARAKGFDIDPALVREARQNAKKAGVEHLVTIEQADFFELDLSEASVIATYLQPSLLQRLVPQFEKLKAGSRIVSHEFEIAGIPATKELTMTLPPPESTSHRLLLWTLPFTRK
jgi:SAM-dependent methyltransferase